MKKFLEVGKIVGTHAIKGEVRVQPWADSGEFLLDFDTLYYREGAEKVDVISARVHKNIVIMKLKGIESVEAADALRGRVLYISREDADLPEGSYFIQDLIGCEIIDADNGTVYGVLEDVYQTPANDVYSVKTTDGRTCLIPAIEQVLAGTDVEKRIVRIHYMEGMFD